MALHPSSSHMSLRRLKVSRHIVLDKETLPSPIENSQRHSTATSALRWIQTGGSRTVKLRNATNGNKQPRRKTKHPEASHNNRIEGLFECPTILWLGDSIWLRRRETRLDDQGEDEIRCLYSEITQTAYILQYHHNYWQSARLSSTSPSSDEFVIGSWNYIILYIIVRWFCIPLGFWGLVKSKSCSHILTAFHKS